MNTLGIFPAELVFNVLSYTDPRDIIRWQTVSKGFCALTHDTLLWKALYANVPFSHPPGPFHSKSVESVQRELVRSAKLAESWTTRPIRGVSTTEIHINEETPKHPKLTGGRWLVGCESEKRFVLHDVDAGAATHARRVLWEQENQVSFWDVFWMPPVEGKYSVYVVFAFALDLDWNLLEFRLNGQSGELHDFALIDTPSSKYILNGEFNLHGKAPFLHIPTLPAHVVFDTRTRIFHEVPESPIMLDETRTKVDLFDSLGRVSWVTFTNNHLIYFRFLLPSTNPCYLTLLQAFTLPPDGSSVGDDNCVLRLTHEGILDTQPVTTTLEILRSSVDPTTKATNVKLLEHPARAQIMRYDLTLPERSSFNVVPITIETQLLHLPVCSVLALHHGYCLHYGNLFDDGRARCFYAIIPHDISPADTPVMKYMIDTTQEPWAFEFGELSHMKRNSIMGANRCMFDGMRGKLCFAGPVDQDSRVQTILVVDVE